MAILKFGAEGATLGDTVSTAWTAAGDTPWNAVAVGAGASFTYTNANVSQGTRAIRIVPNTNQTVGRWSGFTASMSGTVRWHDYWDALPTDLEPSLVWLGSATSTRASQFCFMGSGKVRIYGASTNNTSTAAVPTISGGRHLIFDFHYEIGTSATVRGAVYDGVTGATLVDSGDVTIDTGTVGVSWLRIGQFSGTNTTPHTIDSIYYDTTATGLLGPGLNDVPSVDLITDKPILHPGETATLTASASDSDGSITGTSWSTTVGTIEGSGLIRTLTAPPSQIDQTATITFSATDNGGSQSQTTVDITLKASMSKMYDGSTWVPLVEYLIT